MNRPAKRAQLPYRFHRLDTGGQALLGTCTVHPGATDHAPARHPAMALEVAGDAANGIVRVIPDIDVAIAVEVHRVVAKTARHELRQAHGAGIGAFERQRVELFITGQQQELAQFLAVVAGVATKERFHTDYRNNVLRRHAVFLLGTGQHGLVLAPEVHTTGNARVGEEHRPVVLPRLDLFGRARDGVEDRLLALHFTKHTHQLFRGKTIVAAHFANELGHLR